MKTKQEIEIIRNEEARALGTHGGEIENFHMAGRVAGLNYLLSLIEANGTDDDIVATMRKEESDLYWNQLEDLDAHWWTGYFEAVSQALEVKI